MKLKCVRSYKTINASAIDGVEVPKFMVLTGRNGAGKSNLLAALKNGAVQYDELGELPDGQVRLFALGELLAVVENPTNPSSFREPWAPLHNTVQQWKREARQNPSIAPDGDQMEMWLQSRAVESKLISHAALMRMTTSAAKTLREMDVNDFRAHFPVVSGIKDPFAASISEVFLSYAQRYQANEMQQWRQEKKGTGTPLTDEEFQNRFGSPPWQLLNEALKLVGLPYSFVSPPEDSDDASYEVSLLDEEGNVIAPGDLSSGEQVLLVVALSMYTGVNLSEAIELPRLLLLDEADASLHPSMVKSLLTVIEEIFVKQHGVTTILTTHSPTTVALAPPDSVFVMSRTSPRLQQASRDTALGLLTVGVSALTVSLENRRQVFVESEYDQEIYQDLFRILKSSITTDRSLEFIAAGKRDIGGGCDAVERLVTELRDAGIDTVHGIIDRDRRRATVENVHFLDDRYSIENLMLDPLLLGCLLLRENIRSDVDLGLPSGTRHYSIGAAEAVVICNAIDSRLNLSSSGVAESLYKGGFKVDVPNAFLEMQGHDLEAAVLVAFPELKRFKNKLKLEIVNRVVADVPDLVPAAVEQVFKKIIV